jgi:hypothetical protein
MPRLRRWGGGPMLMPVPWTLRAPDLKWNTPN